MREPHSRQRATRPCRKIFKSTNPAAVLQPSFGLCRGMVGFILILRCEVGILCDRFRAFFYKVLNKKTISDLSLT